MIAQELEGYDTKQRGKTGYRWRHFDGLIYHCLNLLVTLGNYCQYPALTADTSCMLETIFW